MGLYRMVKTLQFYLQPFLRYWQLKGRKTPILPAVTLKPG